MPALLEKYWKILMFIPIVFLVVSLGIIMSNYAATGSFIDRDIELTGGNMITVEVSGDVDLEEIRDALPYARIRLTTGLTNSLLVETSYDVDTDKILDDLSAVGIDGSSSVKTVGPVLGEIFWQQAQVAIVAAFVLIAIVIFLLFRAPVPCSIVIFALITDIVITVALMNLIGIKQSS